MAPALCVPSQHDPLWSTEQLCEVREALLEFPSISLWETSLGIAVLKQRTRGFTLMVRSQNAHSVVDSLVLRLCHGKNQNARRQDVKKAYRGRICTFPTCVELQECMLLASLTWEVSVLPSDRYRQCSLLWTLTLLPPRWR